MKLLNWLNSIINALARNITLWFVAFIVVAGLVAVKVYSTVFPVLPEPPVYGTYLIEQPQVTPPGQPLLTTGWNDARRERYYQASQGSLVTPYLWYKSVEFRTGTQMFASPEVQVKYGLLPDMKNKYNPDGLPVGIIKDIVPDEYVETLGEGHKEWASISCAACHTGQLIYNGNALRIDGGQSFWNFSQWSGDLVFSLMLTSASPPKFERFCGRVYGHHDDSGCTESEKNSLRKQMKEYFNSDLIKSAIDAIMNHTYASVEGYTRTSALGRGVNGEFGPLDQRNIDKNSGPVSFPPLWYTHDFDWVQSPAAIRQPLGRNVTEAWGVSVRVDLGVTDPDKSRLYSSTARIDDMFWIETMLSILQAPKWDEQVLPKINWERAKEGRRLYNDATYGNGQSPDQTELKDWDLAYCCSSKYVQPPASSGITQDPSCATTASCINPGPALNSNRSKTGYCAPCHAPVLESYNNEYGKQYFQLPLYYQKVMDTDPDDAVQFAARKPYTGILADNTFNGKKQVGIGEALNKTVSRIMDKWFETHTVPAECRVIMEGFRENTFRAPQAYPARPLDGYWATGPFLHNGSVRTIYQVLSPVSEREKAFWIGSRRFDPRDLGYENDKIPGAFKYDTTLAGNSNAGHEFRDASPGTPGVIGPTLSPDQRLDIIEYLKVLAFEYDYPQMGVSKEQSVAVAAKIKPEDLELRNKLLNAMGPYYEDYDPAKSHYQTYQLIFEKENSKEEQENQKTIQQFCAGLAPASPGNSQSHK